MQVAVIVFSWNGEAGKKLNGLNRGSEWKRVVISVSIIVCYTTGIGPPTEGQGGERTGETIKFPDLLQLWAWQHGKTAGGGDRGLEGKVMQKRKKERKGDKDKGKRHRNPPAPWESGVELAVCPDVAKRTCMGPVNKDLLPVTEQVGSASLLHQAAHWLIKPAHWNEKQNADLHKIIILMVSFLTMTTINKCWTK